MDEASYPEADRPTSIDWRMSASLENVLRNGGEYPEVTSLEQAVRAWSALDEGHQSQARLMMDRPVSINGALIAAFTGSAIAALLKYLPEANQNPDTESDLGRGSSVDLDPGKP